MAASDNWGAPGESAIPPQLPAPSRRCVYCGSADIDLWASWNVAGEWTCAECTPTDGGS